MGPEDVGRLIAQVTAPFGAGLLSFVAPCVLPLVPGYVGVLGLDGSSGLRRGLASAGFVFGLAGTFALFDAAAAQGGAVLITIGLFVMSGGATAAVSPLATVARGAR